MAKRDPLEKIRSDVQRLQQRASILRSTRRSSEIRSIVQRMREHSITPGDLLTAYRASKAKGVGRKVPPKYRNPESGETWSGRGKLPRWLHAAEHAGGDRKQFLIR